MVNETTLDNVLVHQKDKIILLISKGEFREAMGVLSIVRELWDVCGYQYKRRELLQRGIDEIQHRLNDEGKLHWKKRESLESLQSQLRYNLEH